MRDRKREASVAERGAAHLVNFLGSEGGVGGGSGLLVLSSSWWMGELGMGSRRLGWGGPLPVPPASALALRLGELLNRVDDLSFFRFCYTEEHKNKQQQQKYVCREAKRAGVACRSRIELLFCTDWDQIRCRWSSLEALSCGKWQSRSARCVGKSLSWQNGLESKELEV